MGIRRALIFYLYVLNIFKVWKTALELAVLKQPQEKLNPSEYFLLTKLSCQPLYKHDTLRIAHYTWHTSHDTLHTTHLDILLTQHQVLGHMVQCAPFLLRVISIDLQTVLSPPGAADVKVGSVANHTVQYITFQLSLREIIGFQFGHKLHVARDLNLMK